MNIEDIKNFLENQQQLIKKLTLNCKKPGLLKCNINLLKNIVLNSNGLIKSNSELIYLIKNKNNLENLHIFCKCGNKNNFINHKYGYCFHCSIYCEYHKRDKLKKMQDTCEKNNGVKNPYQIPRVRQEAMDFYNNPDNVEKRNIKIQNTKFQRCGYRNNFSSPDPKLNGRAKCKELYGDEEIFRTEHFKKVTARNNIKKFGKKSYSQTDEYKNLFKDKEWVERRENKKSETVEARYGCKYTSQVKEFKDKRLNTLRKNKTFNTSMPEQRCYELLKSRFTDTINHYKDERYPFECDLYIPSKDLFIELNFFWTHYKEPFDKNNQEHLKRLDILKSKNTKFYRNAIYTWTDLDVRKLKTFIDNKLNYKIFYREKEFVEWFKGL